MTEQFQQVVGVRVQSWGESGCCEGSSVALFSTLVVMGRRERPPEGKAVLGILSFLKDP